MSRRIALRAFAGAGGMLFIAYLFFFNAIEPSWVGIARNILTGEITLQDSGWHVTAPWVQVSRIDARPQRVCITSASRGFNCRLVQFVPNAYREFIATEGFRYYWWANRISINFGYSDEYRGMRDLLRGYGYSVKQYPFVITLRQYQYGE